ncbi:MAG: hypothetical protein ACRC6A_03405 [Fusobacteriaceae bacterium]
MSENDLLDIIQKEIGKYIIENKILKNKKEKVTILGEDLIILKELEKKFQISEDSHKIVVINLEINELFSLANATYLNPKTEFIIECLLNNKQIYIVEEGIAWRNFNCNTKKIVDKYLNYEKELKEMKIKIVKKIEILSCLDSKIIKKYYNKKILTLKDIKEIEREEVTELIVLDKMLVTDSAQEYLRNSILKIKKG